MALMSGLVFRHQMESEVFRVVCDQTGAPLLVIPAKAGNDEKDERFHQIESRPTSISIISHDDLDSVHARHERETFIPLGKRKPVRDERLYLNFTALQQRE